MTQIRGLPGVGWLIRRVRDDRRLGRRGGRRWSDHEPKRGWMPALALALFVALADWGTKAAVAAAVPLGGFRELVPGQVALWHVRNRAMVLGLYGDLPLPARQAIAALAAIAAVVLISEILGRGHRLPRGQRGWVWAFVGLSLGGMLGNLGERLLHWGVTDFLSFRYGDLWLPPGNLADLALISAIPLCFVVMALELRARAQRSGRADGRAQQQPAAAADPDLLANS